MSRLLKDEYSMDERKRDAMVAYLRRDINSTENILAAGRRRLAEGNPVLPAPGAAAVG